MAPIIRKKKIDEGTFPVLRLVVSRVLRLYATCSSSRVPIRCLQPLDTLDLRDSPRVYERICARTLTKLAINLFALLNVILFHCWIKRTGNLMFLRPVHVISSLDVSSHVIEERDYLPSVVSAAITHIHIHRVNITKQKIKVRKRSK